MNQDTGTRLLAALNAERAALLDFTALLEREQAMLIENNTDQLLELAGKKTSDAIKLNELAAACHNLLRKNIPQLDAGIPKDSPDPVRASSINRNRDAIRSWMEKHSPACLSVWHEILGLSERAKQLNSTNGELIQMKLRLNQQTLTVLSNAANKANLYGPDGQTSFSAGGGRSLGSG